MKFKPGDKVLRIGETYQAVVKGNIYEVLEISNQIFGSGYSVILKGYPGVYDEDKFRLVGKPLPKTEVEWLDRVQQTLFYNKSWN